MAEAVTLLTSIQEVLGLNPDEDANYPNLL
jgi:hypothetical protein